MIIEKLATCDSSKVIDVVKSLVPDATCLLNIGSELSMLLPSDATMEFAPLFEALESMYTIIIIPTHVSM